MLLSLSSPLSCASTELVRLDEVRSWSHACLGERSTITSMMIIRMVTMAHRSRIMLCMGWPRDLRLHRQVTQLVRFPTIPVWPRQAIPVPVAGVQLLSLWSTPPPGGLRLQLSLSPCAPDPWVWACGAATRPCPQRSQGSFQCRRFLVGKRWRSPT